MGVARQWSLLGIPSVLQAASNLSTRSVLKYLIVSSRLVLQSAFRAGSLDLPKKSKDCLVIVLWFITAIPQLLGSPTPPDTDTLRSSRSKVTQHPSTRIAGQQSNQFNTMPTMFRKRKDANEETMAMGRVVGVRNASPAHRVAALHEREGEAAITVQKSFRGMKGRQAKWYWEESAELRQSHDFLPSSPCDSVCSMARAPPRYRRDVVHVTAPLLDGVGTSTPSPQLVDRRAGPERVHKHANIKKGTRWVPFDKATTQKLEDAGSSAQIKFRGAPPIHW